MTVHLIPLSKRAIVSGLEGIKCTPELSPLLSQCSAASGPSVRHEAWSGPLHSRRYPCRAGLTRWAARPWGISSTGIAFVHAGTQWQGSGRQAGAIRQEEFRGGCHQVIRSAVPELSIEGSMFRVDQSLRREIQVHLSNLLSRLALSLVMTTIAASPVMAGTYYAEVRGLTRVLHKQSSWGVCADAGDQPGVRPFRPMQDGPGDFSEVTRAYAGYRTKLRPGQGPFPCHHAVDTIGEALFQISMVRRADGTPLDRALTADLPFIMRMATFEITSFTSASPGGVVSGATACGHGEPCPRPRPPSNCRFQLLHVPPGTGFTPTLSGGRTSREAHWEGDSRSIATPIPSGRGFMLVSGTNQRNGNAWVITEQAREWFRRPRGELIMTIADSEPSLAPQNRMKEIECDGYFTARLTVFYDDE